MQPWVITRTSSPSFSWNIISGMTLEILQGFWLFLQYVDTQVRWTVPETHTGGELTEHLYHLYTSWKHAVGVMKEVGPRTMVKISTGRAIQFVTIINHGFCLRNALACNHWSTQLLIHTMNSICGPLMCGECNRDDARGFKCYGSVRLTLFNGLSHFSFFFTLSD